MTDGYKIKRVLTWVNGEEKQIYPAKKPWEPGADTLAYWKLNGNLNDETGNYNLTNSGTSFYNDTSIGKQVLYCDGNSHYVYTTSLPSSSTYTITLNIWSKGIDLFHANRNLFDGYLSGNNYFRWESSSSSVYLVFWGHYPDLGLTSTQLNNWGLLTVTYNRNNNSYQAFFNSVLKTSGTVPNGMPSSWLSNFTLGMGFQVANTRSYYGYIGEVVLENKIWTSDDVTDFYNKTKSNYGL